MKFSIIVPVYNVAEYLDECLRSISVQSFSDWEAICVDDGSTDASGAILDAWAKKDARFRVFHKANGGVSSARNFALEKADGDYLWFVDGDDVVAPDSLKTLVDAVALGGNPDIVQFRLEKFLDKPSFDVATEPPVRYDLRNRQELAAAYREHAPWLLGSSAIYSRALYGNERFENMANCEDSIWGRRAFYKARDMIYLPRALYGYRQRHGSANDAWTKQRWCDYCRAGWIMTLEGLKVPGLRLAVIDNTVRYCWHAVLYRKRIVAE